MKRLFSAIILILSSLNGPYAAEPYLNLTLELDYSVLGFADRQNRDKSAEPPLEYEEIREKALRVMLEEAQWIFSGMIYGFDFRYIPGNQAEGLDELFILEGIKQLPKGDPDMKVQQLEDNGRAIRVRFHYWPDEFQIRRLKIPESGGFLFAAAEGSCSIMEKNARLLAMKEGVKQALREDLRSLVYNRPLEVRGHLFLSSEPRLKIRSGEYRGLVSIVYKSRTLESFPLNY